MTAVGWLEVVAGILIVVGSFYDLFKSVVLPRPSINRFVMVRLLFFSFWMLWQWVGRRIQNVARSEGWLATLGPSAGVAVFLTWAIAFLLRDALILPVLLHQIRP